MGQIHLVRGVLCLLFLLVPVCIVFLRLTLLGKKESLFGNALIIIQAIPENFSVSSSSTSIGQVCGSI